MRFNVISAKNRSTRLSHDALVGVKCSLKRGCFSSQALTPASCGWRSCRARDGRRAAWGRRGQYGAEIARTPWPVAREAFTDDPARLHIECCEQRGRAVALVIMGHGGRAALLEREARLGSVERLNLRLLINTKHDRPVWRIEVKPDDLGDLLLEHWVVQHLEPAYQVRLQTRFRPDATNARRQVH